VTAGESFSGAAMALREFTFSLYKKHHDRNKIGLEGKSFRWVCTGGRKFGSLLLRGGFMPEEEWGTRFRRRGHFCFF